MATKQTSTSDLGTNDLTLYLQRAEVRLSTHQRVAGAFISGAGLLMLLPILFKEAAITIFVFLTGVFFTLPFLGWLLVIPFLISLSIPLYSLYLLLRDLIQFYFTGNFPEYARYAKNESQKISTLTKLSDGMNKCDLEKDHSPELIKKMESFIDQYNKLFPDSPIESIENNLSNVDKFVDEYRKEHPDASQDMTNLFKEQFIKKEVEKLQTVMTEIQTRAKQLKNKEFLPTFVVPASLFPFSIEENTVSPIKEKVIEHEYQSMFASFLYTEDDDDAKDDTDDKSLRARLTTRFNEWFKSKRASLFAKGGGDAKDGTGDKSLRARLTTRFNEWFKSKRASLFAKQPTPIKPEFSPPTRQGDAINIEPFERTSLEKHIIKINEKFSKAGAVDRNLYQEVVFTEFCLVRNAIRLRELVLRYAKSVLVVTWTTVISFIVIAALSGSCQHYNLSLTHFMPFISQEWKQLFFHPIPWFAWWYFVWSVGVMMIVKQPLIWIHSLVRNEEDKAISIKESIGKEKSTKKFQELVVNWGRIALISSIVSFIIFFTPYANITVSETVKFISVPSCKLPLK